jgi:hypothetical protein
MLLQKAAARHVQQLLARLRALVGPGGSKLDTAGAPASAAGVLLLAGMLAVLLLCEALLIRCSERAAAARRTSREAISRYKAG